MDISIRAARSHRLVLLAVGAVAGLVLGLGVTAVAVDPTEQLTACVDNRRGDMRLVESASECNDRREVAVTWGVTGPAGADGSLALAGQECPEGTAVVGFDAQGDITCGSPADSGGPTDADGDGYTSDIDCDDDDAAVNPGATEVPDNTIDDDCDGVVDEVAVDCDDGNPGTIDIVEPGGGCSYEYVDQDGDGFTFDVDCNDSNAAVSPAAIEVPGNDIDDDCDGEVDEDNAP